MFAVYGFCRAVDDIADERGAATPAERLAGLERWRADIAAMFAGKRAARPRRPRRGDAPLRSQPMRISTPSSTAWRWTPREDIRAPDWATLDLYCDRVASAVGRLSVRIFGLAPEPGVALAHHLGRALQLTNILRDIDEDASDRPALSAARGADARQA